MRSRLAHIRHPMVRALPTLWVHDLDQTSQPDSEIRLNIRPVRVGQHTVEPCLPLECLNGQFPDARAIVVCADIDEMGRIAQRRSKVMMAQNVALFPAVDE
jgi:hypothetical protein